MIFTDFEDAENPLNGTRVDFIEAPLRKVHGRRPFMAELRHDCGSVLTLGIGDECGMVQHSPANGDPPYWVALGGSGAYEFIAISRYFAETGGRLPFCQWEEI